MTRIKKFSRIEVEFDDPAIMSGWTDGPEAEGMTSQPCRATGYLLSSSPKDLVVSLLLGDANTRYDQANGVFAIPHGCIRRVIVLEPRKARTRGTAR
jgi:hypothetical protein